MFSYGSGLASSMFSLTVKRCTKFICDKLDVSERLESRTCVSPEVFTETMNLRELAYTASNYTPKSTVDSDNFFRGTYYLVEIDEKSRRSYARFE